MFIGHFGLGLASKKIDNVPSLGTYFLAAQFLDLLWPFFLLIGLEEVKIDPGNTVLTPLNFVYYPFSHSLFAALIWSILFGLIYFLIKKNIKASITLGVLVLSHWILDFFVHKPDLPITPWSNLKVGLGIWNSIGLTIFIEFIIFIAGIYFYIKATGAKNKKGKYGFWSLIVFLIIIYISNIFGSPPPSQNAIAIVGFFQWILIIWAYWIDKNRIVN